MKTPKTTPRQTVRTSRAATAAAMAPVVPVLSPSQLDPEFTALLVAYAGTLKAREAIAAQLEALAADADKTVPRQQLVEANAKVDEASAAIDAWVMAYGAARLAATLGEAKPAERSLHDLAPDGTTMVRVAGPKLGRWRIGRQFFAEPVELEVDADQLAALEGDPRLSVSRL